MANTLIKKRQIEPLGIVNADIASGAAIATSKLAEGSLFLKKDGTVTPTADLPMGGYKLTGLGAPSSANDAVRLVDLQNSTAGISGKDSVRVATTANITLSGAQTIDGISVVAGDRVLVKNQTTGADNGIYVCATGAWSRAADADSAGEVKAGNFVFATEGTINADSAWILSTDGAITIGTTTQTWTQFAKAGQVLDGNGLYYIGNTLHIGVVSGQLVANANDIGLATIGTVTPGSGYNTFTVNQFGQVTLASTTAYLTIASNRVTRETPAGTKNGTNTAFSLANTPIAGTEEIFVNGLLQTVGAGNDYVISSGTITFAVAPESDAVISACYWK